MYLYPLLACSINDHITTVPNRRAKLGQIQGGLQRSIQDSTKGGLQYFFTFYALKIELFRVFTLSD